MCQIPIQQTEARVHDLPSLLLDGRRAQAGRLVQGVRRLKLLGLEDAAEPLPVNRAYDIVHDLDGAGLAVRIRRQQMLLGCRSCYPVRGSAELGQD